MVRSSLDQIASASAATPSEPNLINRNQPRSQESSSWGNSSPVEEDSLPVFIFPQVLYFYANDNSTLKREVKIYNPYDWPVRFKVYTTSKKKYEVDEPEGVISPKYNIEMTIRLLDTSPCLIGHTDHLRIQMRTFTGVIKAGKRDLPCLYLPEKGHREERDGLQRFLDSTPLNVESIAFHRLSLKTPPIDDKTHEITAPTIKQPSDTQGANRKKSNNRQHTNNSNNNNEPTTSWSPSAYIFTAIICGIVLCLPTEESILPTYLVISHTPKFIAAYVLGIITSLLCKYY